ncbi:TSUP family transporter [Hoeflea sp. G2-23]|uniref:Probable membrane transporter protein n=1 Tax=Hoeflea algicola TaxID=2983763 RepID=A0ABT3ZA98_9HYPH|nr:TSUP family transporter [Hoeflea algicola]MCY0148176.1 TSUP family transporter [Hoeflea algicola]
MSLLAISFFAFLAVGTSFLSGVFGMAGGMLLMGGLLYMVPVGDAMILHGLTQLTSNGWRALLWRPYVRWTIIARYGLGLLLAGALFSSMEIVPQQELIFLILGLVPFIGRVLPAQWVPPVNQRAGAEICGFIGTSFQLLSGVSGPMLDIFFIRSPLNRREIVATKAMCQVITHISKLLYFGMLIRGETTDVTTPPVIAIAALCAVVGTILSRSVLDRLTDTNFRRYTWWILYAIGTAYLARSLYSLIQTT